MEKYFATRIIDLHETDNGLEYTAVITRYPQLKDKIDAELKARGYESLIVVTE